MRINKYVLLPALLATSFYCGMKFSPEKKYVAFEKGHDWFLQTPTTTLPIYENNQVGTVHYRMKGLLEEDVSVLSLALSKIRQEAKDISKID